MIAPCGYRLEGAVALAEQAIAEGLTPVGVPVWAVDADAAYVRPGPRLVDGVEALAGVLHPDAVTPRPDLATYVGVRRAQENTNVEGAAFPGRVDAPYDS